MSLSNQINNYSVSDIIENGLGENDDETHPLWRITLETQLRIQQKLYTFFGTRSKEEIEKFIEKSEKRVFSFKNDPENAFTKLTEILTDYKKDAHKILLSFKN